jgi:hypothetical protein
MKRFWRFALLAIPALYVAFAAVNAYAQGGVTISSGPGMHLNNQTVNYTGAASDCGNEVSMNGANLTFTVQNPPPSSTCPIWVQDLNATTLSISRNSLTINGVAANPTPLNQYQVIKFWTDGSNWFADLPVSAGGCLVNCTWWPFIVQPYNLIATVTNAANNPLLFQFTKNSTDKATKISIYVVTNIAATTGDVGLYGNCTTTCALLWHSGSISTAAVGVVSATIAPVTTGPGTYYLSVCDSSASVGWNGVQINGGETIVANASPVLVTATDATDTCTAGVLPATVTVANFAGATPVSVPIVGVGN